MDQKRHILFFVASLGVGGAQKIASFVMNVCVDNSFKVSVISLSSEEANVKLANQINIHYLKYQHKSKIFRKLDEIFQTKSMIKNLNPDLIVIFGSYTIPSIGAVMTGIPILGCERGDPFTYSRFRQFLNKRLYKHYLFSVFQSEGAREYYNLNYKKTKVICNPCFEVNQYNGEKENIISAAGRLTKDKGFDTLIDSFALIHEMIPEYQLIIYGDGPYKDELTQRIKSYQLENKVILYGKVQNLVEYIKNSKLFVLSSLYEGLPNVLIEAMSIGLPIVSTDCSPGGARFLMDNGNRGGLIVPVNNPRAMADKILFMIKNYDTAVSLGNKGKELAKLFSEKEIRTQWENLFNHIFEQI